MSSGSDIEAVVDPIEEEELAEQSYKRDSIKVRNNEDDDALLSNADKLKEIKYPLREVRGLGLRINPCVFFFGTVFLWCVIIGLYLEPAGSSETYAAGKTGITKAFTWFYILSQDVWFIVLIFVYFKFGHIKLGRPHEKAEFSDANYFMMIFSAGIGTGLFFFALEPVDHMNFYADNRFTNNEFVTEDERDMMALNQTLFHWGLLGWVTYSIIAIALALMSYRHGLPLTIRSALFPLLGRHTFGWIGDVLDGISVVTVVSGVVTDLVIGAVQIGVGLKFLGFAASDMDDLDLKIIVVWVVIGMAAVSVFTGLHRGIKYLSMVGFLLGTFVWAGVLFSDKTEYILNLFVESIGYHFQYFIQLSFTTDAFGQLSAGEGRAIDGNSAKGPDASSESSWMDWWTIFYWGWWIAWSPFVGLFLARISRGRTIASVVKFTMFVPFFYIICWFAVFGGAGLRMERRAAELEAAGAEPWIDEVGIYATIAYAASWYNQTAINLGEVEGQVVFADWNSTYDELLEAALYDGRQCYNVSEDAVDAGISPVCKMTGFDTAYQWFRLLNQYGEIGNLLNMLGLVAMIIYFVTSSDSGALVVDKLTANGGEDHSSLQRVLWAITQGGVATVVLLGDGVLTVQAFTVIAGLPYTIVLCLISASLWKALKNDDLMLEHGIEVYTASLENNAHYFNFPLYGGIFDGIELASSLGSISAAEKRGYKTGAWKLVPTFLLSLAAPFFVAFGIQMKVFSDRKLEGTIYTVAMGLLFGGTIILILIGLADSEREFMFPLAAVTYFGFAATVTRLRYTFRDRFNIVHSNVFEDFFGSLFLYPQVLSQMVNHMMVVQTPTESYLE